MAVKKKPVEMTEYGKNAKKSGIEYQGRGAELAEIFSRFRFESRREFAGSGKWLVAYDKYLGRYVTEGGRDRSSCREYKRFEDSDDAIKWFLMHVVSTEEDEGKEDK